METITLNKNELQELVETTVRKALIDVLTYRKDLLEDAFIEAIEDIGLVKAMQEVANNEELSLEESQKLLADKNDS